MKVLSINEAVEKNLLNHIGGLSLKEDIKIMQVKDKKELEYLLNKVEGIIQSKGMRNKKSIF